MQYIKSLDTYRFAAFFIVLISHATLFLHLGVNNLHTGDLGVSMFFVLSGFLITTILWTELQKNGDIDLYNFYNKRVRRILPLYAIIVAIGILIIPNLYSTEYFRSPFTNLSHNPLWQYLTFTFNFYNENHFLGNTLITTMLWSICVEEQFYLIWPSVVKFAKKTNYLVYILIFCFVISFFFRFFNYNVSSQVEFNTLSVMNDLVIGCLLSLLYYYKKDLLEKFVTLNGFFYVSCTTLFLVYFRSEYLIGDRIWVTTEPIIFSLLFAYILLSFIKFKSWQVFNIPLINYLGKISYGLYIYHTLCFMLSIQLVKYLSTYISLPGEMEFILSLPLLFVVAHISYNYFEVKLLKKKSTLQSVPSIS